ncbi:hypothetical protein TNCT_238361 [Trichonephila clavata]|uniref:Uncharacterized protein n=1 Tax=Trichonephila clavata TaxID=2740835 RepID=A0A8X6M4F3_TRICU|nr:hypothetical protein TNCT_238361 [Trichonephila clavata]
MGLKSIGKERVTHGLFGGLEKTECHNRYNIQLNSLDTKNKIEIEETQYSKNCCTNTVTKLEHELLETEHIDVDKLEEILEILVTKFESLKCIDNELEPLFGEIEFEEEYTKTEEYHDKVTLTKFRVNKRIRELNKNVSNFPANVSHDVEKINQVYQPNINIEE